MKTYAHKLHLRYVMHEPHVPDNNCLEDLFARLDAYEPIERMAVLDFTCCVFGIDVPLEYRSDPELADLAYRRFKKRCKRLSNFMYDFAVTYVVALLTLAIMRHRSDIEVGLKYKQRWEDSVEHLLVRIENGEGDRKALEDSMKKAREAANNVMANVRLSRKRYVRFCEEVVAYLM